MPGIGQQRERARDEANAGLGRDIGQVEGDADGEGAAVIERRVRLVAGIAVMMGVVIVRQTRPRGETCPIIAETPAKAGVSCRQRFSPALDSDARARVTAPPQNARSRPMLEAYLYTGLRSPFGRHAGALARLRPDDMLAGVIARVVAESGFAADKIEDVVVGCANQGGEDSRCVARHAALVAGLPIEIPGSVLQRNCGSGLNAIAVAAQAITCGEGEVFVAGGVESMSRAPFVMGKAEAPFSRDARVFDSTIGARFPNPKVEGRYGADTMPETADNLARDYQISREAGRCLRRGLAAEIRRRQGRRVLRRRDHRGRGAGRPRRAGHGRRGRASAAADRHGGARQIAAVVQGRRHHRRQRLRHQ